MMETPPPPSIQLYGMVQEAKRLLMSWQRTSALNKTEKQSLRRRTKAFMRRSSSEIVKLDFDAMPEVVGVGVELKQAESSLLLDIGKEALKLHSTLEGRKFTNADDVQAFRNDIIRLEGLVGDLDSNARRAQRWFNTEGKCRCRPGTYECGSPDCNYKKCECGRDLHGFVDPTGKGRCRYCAADTGDAHAE